MTKQHNMGRKSHKAQDAQLDQNLKGLQQDIGAQPTRPYVRQRQAKKSSGDEPRPTK
jgi:hypothetical protein